MSVVLTEQQQELCRTVRRAIREHHGSAGAVELAEPGAVRSDAAVWKAFSDIGVPAIGLPGSGAGLLDLGLVVQEAGRGLLPGTLLGHALAQRLLLAAGDSAAGVLSQVEEQDLRLAASWQLEPARLEVEDGGVVRGRASAVSEGPSADLLVLLSSRGDRPAIACVGNEHLSFAADPVGALDTSRDWTVLDFEAEPLSVHEVEPNALERARLEAALLVCFDSVGSAEQCLDDAIRYAKERHQFGQAIGGFQAVKHLLVDAHVLVDNARSATWHAAAAIDVGSPDAAFSVHVAKAVSDDAHTTAAATGIQVHGGMGFTREVAAHLHARRSRYNQRLGGSATDHLQALAGELPAVLGEWTDANTEYLRAR